MTNSSGNPQNLIVIRTADISCLGLKGFYVHTNTNLLIYAFIYINIASYYV